MGGCGRGSRSRRGRSRERRRYSTNVPNERARHDATSRRSADEASFDSSAGAGDSAENDGRKSRGRGGLELSRGKARGTSDESDSSLIPPP